MTVITPDDIGGVRGDLMHVLSGLNDKTPPVEVVHPFNLSLIPVTHDNGVSQPTWSGTVTLQRGFLTLINNTNMSFRRYIPTGEQLIWNTVAQYTGSFESIDNKPSGAFYRVVVTSYTDGSIIVAVTQ